MSSSEVKHLADPMRPGVGRLSFVVNGKPEPWTKFRKRESGEKDVKEPENEAYVAYEIRFFIDPYELEEPKGRSNAIGVERSNGTMKLWHTYVPESMRGKGIAEIVVEQAMEWAYANCLSVDPACSYVRETFIEKQPRWKHQMVGVD